MDELKSSNQGNDDVPEGEFVDASDEFPFYDCEESFHDQIECDDADVSSNVTSLPLDSKPPLEESTIANLRRRRFTSRSPSSSVSSGEEYIKNSDDAVGYSDELTEIEAENSSTMNSGDLDENEFNLSSGVEKGSESYDRDEDVGSSSRISEKPDGDELKFSSRNVENGESEDLDEDPKEYSTVTCLEKENSNEFSEGNSNLRETPDVDSSFFIVLASLIIKAIGFQFNLLISFITFPLWMLYSSYMFIVDPFGIMKRAREYLYASVYGIWLSVFGNLSAGVYKWGKENQSLLKLGVKFGWGFLWSVYVCVILVGLLVSAFVVGGILINTVVEKPIRIQENLNFDFTEKSPAAYLPIIGCPGQDCGVDCKAKLAVMDYGAMRVIPPDHKLQVTVSLTLPESDYNRNLGIFQVRVDLLDPDGKTLTSSRRPCMLQFRSEPIRLLLTFLKVFPLITGYASESQDLNIKFRGFIEGVRPTACLRVAIEQRAQFAPGAGVPEIYAGSVTLESQQPLLKRILWYWRITLFTWISMTIFAVELLFTLICCKPIIIPRVKLRRNSARIDAPPNNGPLQNQR